MSEKRARCIAFYLPAFYPFPENDAWWGKGFTEWTLVQDAKPLLKGHTQPRVPAKRIGYYNTKDAETRSTQAALAQDCGIEAFCYWHMWFGGGKTLLRETVDAVMQSGVPDMPFCVAWANQSWTRRWARSGTAGRTLVEQQYLGEADDRAHFASILPMLKDARYVRVDGKPLFILYKPFAIPNLETFMALWNTLARDNGLPGIFFVGIVSGNADAPHVPGLNGFMRNQPATDLLHYGRRALAQAYKGNVLPLLRCLYGLIRRPQVFDHRAVSDALQNVTFNENEFPQILTNWDDTPRHGKRGTVFTHSHPAFLASALERATLQLASRPLQERLIFLKSWNEWGEGNYIEPDTVSGTAYLDAIRNILQSGR